MKAVTFWILGISLCGLTTWNLAQEAEAPEPGPTLVQQEAPPVPPPPVEPEEVPLPPPPVLFAEEEAEAPPEAPAEAVAEPAPPQLETPDRPALPERARGLRNAPGAPSAARAPAREGAGTPPAGTSETERNLRLNFRGAPLEMVLDYLSEAASFIIVLETEVRGKVDVWSNQPLNKTEAVELLNRVLARNGYAALQDGRNLIITTREEAKKRDIPVRAGNNPAEVPRSEAIVTQIIPVRFINAVQLARDLQPLFPPSATIASNEGGNALVVTDTLINIRRIMEIVRALDTSLASVSTVRVFPLRYADAKELATVVRDLFASATATGRSGNQQQQIIFRGFRGGPPDFGGNNGNQQTATGNGRVPPPQVVAVADERSNSLVVSAPEDQMPLIADLIEQVDVSVEDVTELRVFRLRYADAQETADLLTSLFPDPTTQNNRGQGGRFGGFRPPQLQQAGTQQPSERVLRQSRVLAVADLRTQSVVVSASRELMDQIAVMIAQLDNDPARKQRVYTFSVENTDPAAVEEILRGLFETQNTRNRAATTRNTTRQAGSQLNNRAVNTMQNQGRTGVGTGFGGGAATGFGTGGAGR